MSGSNVPGEGEHKIFEHIWECKTGSHCIYGNDADLIMLGLAVETEDIYICKETYLTVD